MNRQIIRFVTVIAVSIATAGAAFAQGAPIHADHHAVLILAAMTGESAPVKAGNLTLSAPMIKATPPNAPVSGGYLAIANGGAEADRLVSASADFAGKVEIHEMTMEGDVMKMRPLDAGIEIPAGGAVELKPGGLHIMFMSLKEQLKAGDKRKVRLVFEKAGEVELEFGVMEMKPGHMNHGG